VPDAQFTVPYPEHPHFVGREEDLARLHAALQGQGPVGINPAAMGNPTGVTGQGGIGKTQLAVAYAYRYREHYPDGVYWLNAAEGLWSAFAGLGRHFLGQGDSQALKARLWETLRSRFSIEEIRDLCLELGVNYEEFSPQLGISPLARELVARCERHGQLALLEAAVRRLRGDLAQPQAQDELVLHAFTWLRGHPGSLLILDNLVDPAALDKPLARDCVPGHLPNRVLFTTRRRELGRFRPVELKTLPPDAALELLLRDYHRQPVLDRGHSEHATARDICAVFGYLPLVLEIAAAHLAKFHNAPLTAYRDELRQRGALDVIADKRVATDTRHEAGLAAALEAQWATLGDEAQMLLRVAGQLSEAAYIPTARLGLLAGVPEEVTSFFDVTLSLALNELQNASLIEELAGDQLRLHPLVREFARARTPRDEKESFLVACVQRLLTAFGNLRILEQQCDARGIDALIVDLLAAVRFLDDVTSGKRPHDNSGASLKELWRNFHSSVSKQEDKVPRPLYNAAREDMIHDLQSFLRLFRREAYTLRGWRRSDALTFLTQQLYLRVFDNAMLKLFSDLPAHIQSYSQIWFPHWIARSKSALLEMTLTGHKGSLQAVALTSDQRKVVSGGVDGSLNVWNLETGKAELTLTGHMGGVFAVAVTPDGQRVISGAGNGTLHVWNLDTGKAEKTLRGHTGTVQALAVTPNGQRLISGGRDEILRFWNLETGELEWARIGHTRGVLAVAVMPDGRRVISGGGDGILRVWNLDTGAEERALNDRSTREMDEVWTVVVMPDGRRAVSGGSDGRLRIWNLSTGKVERAFAMSITGVRAVAATPDGRRVITSGGFGSLRVWNLYTGKEEQRLTTLAHGAQAVAVTPDGGQVISGNDEGVLQVWNLATSDATEMPTGHTDSVRAVAVTPDGRLAISVGGFELPRICNLATGEVVQEVTARLGITSAMAATLDGSRMISGGLDGIVHIWNLKTGKEERKLAGHTESVLAVGVTPDGERAISSGIDGTLRVWNLTTGEKEHILTNYKGVVVAVAVTPDGQKAVCGRDDGTLDVWNLDTGEAERTLVGHAGTVQALAVTPDGQRVVSGGRDEILRFWNLETGELEWARIGHTGGVRAVAVMPDGRRVVSGGVDRTLRMWNLATGHELAHAVLDEAVLCVTISCGSPPLIVAGDKAGNVYCLEWVE
jgi:WD40 repeat protein